MYPFFAGVRHGIVKAAEWLDNAFEDKREPNRARPRMESEDPTQKIDDQKPVQIINFPHDRPKYYMTFGFEAYRRPTQFEGLKSDGISEYIALPLPSNLIDNNHMSYTEANSGFLVEASTRIWQTGADGFAADNIEGAISSLKNMDNLVKGGEIFTGLGLRKMVDAARAAANLAGADKGFVDAALQLPGLADNPFSTVAFKGPTFKTHHFVWRLSPKSASESVTIKKITEAFKAAAHPELLTAGAGGFYKYPHIVWINFQPKEAKENLYKFKACVITDVKIDYSPNDRPGFYHDAAPVEVVLELGFKEIELWRNGTGKTVLRDFTAPTIDNGDFDLESIPVRRLD